MGMRAIGAAAAGGKTQAEADEGHPGKDEQPKTQAVIARQMSSISTTSNTRAAPWAIISGIRKASLEAR